VFAGQDTGVAIAGRRERIKGRGLARDRDVSRPPGASRPMSW
jgi:hypothetical protein